MSNNALDHDFASKFDYVMVFPKDKDGDNYSQTAKSKAIIDLMIRRGFEIFAYDSVQGDELIVLLRCDEEVLKTFTDVIDYELELDPIKAEEFMTKGNPEKCISPVHINPDPAYSRFTPYQYIYGKYDGKIDPALYRKHPSQQNAQFKESIRLKMVYYMLEAATRFGGCNISFSDLFRNNDLLALYPMHHLVYGNILLKQMVSRETYPWTIPHDSLKEYFGEKVALYYCFLGNYTKMLIYPSIVGFICQMVVWGTGNTSSPVLPFFAIFVCLWAIAMLEYWKREEQLTAMRWGMLNYENQEPDRPEFEGTLISSYIDGQPMMFFPKHDARKRNRYSVAIVCSMVLMVIGVVTSIYVIRFALQSSSVAPYSSLVASVLNTIQITIFNIIYNKVATKLTDYENHRTDTNYEDSMIVKLFAFQFVNSYASFFFLAFIAAHLNKPPSDDDSAADNVGQCGAETCMTPLATNLAIIFGTKITVNSCLEVILPYKAYKDKLKAETEGTTKTLSRPEKDYMLLPYDIMAESIKDYADTAIQFGFMTLFITALPIACLFSLLSCIIKVKVNGW